MANEEEIRRLRLNYIKELLMIKNSIFHRAVRIVHYKRNNMPKIILDNEERLLNEMVEKYDDINNRLGTIEQTEAVDMGKYSCDYCLLYDEEFCKDKKPCKDFTRDRDK